MLTNANVRELLNEYIVAFTDTFTTPGEPEPQQEDSGHASADDFHPPPTHNMLTGKMHSPDASDTSFTDLRKAFGASTPTHQSPQIPDMSSQMGGQDTVVADVGHSAQGSRISILGTPIVKSRAPSLVGSVHQISDMGERYGQKFHGIHTPKASQQGSSTGSVQGTSTIFRH